MTTREGFTSALNKLALSGDVNTLADAYSNAVIQQDRQDIETSLIAGIEVCGRHGWVNDVVRLLGRTDLSDTVRQQIETSLVTGIEVCGRKGLVDAIVRLLKRTDLSDTVMLAGIKACKREGWVNDVARLLKRTDLSDTVRQAAEKVVPQSRPATPTDVVHGYLQGRKGNPLAHGGVMSAGTVRGPNGIAPTGSKPGKVTV